MKTAILLPGVIASLGLSAQSELPKFVSKPASLYKDIVDDVSKDYHLRNKDQAKMPKKVALVSFFTFDPGLTKSYSWETMTHYGTTTMTRNSGGNSGALAAAWYVTSIGGMKAKFKEYGMELLEPEEYLNTDAKKDSYKSFKVEHDSMSKWVNSMGSGGHSAMYGYPEGYMIADVVAEPFSNYAAGGGLFGAFKSMDYSKKVGDKQLRFYENDTKMMTTLGYDLAKKLEVDAVVVVYATIYCPGEKKIMLQNVTMSMFGPNPLQLEEGKKKMFYSRGLWYAGSRLTVHVPILDVDKKKPETAKLDPTGFDVIMTQLSARLGDYLYEELGLKK